MKIRVLLLDIEFSVVGMATCIVIIVRAEIGDTLQFITGACGLLLYAIFLVCLHKLEKQLRLIIEVQEGNLGDGSSRILAHE